MYDVVVIGAGPGGYIGAERAGQQGKKVLLVEKGELGGVCLNEGCIPTKTLLHAAKVVDHALNSQPLGVQGEKVRFDIQEAMKWKNSVIETNRKGIAFLMKKHGVEVVRGRAVFKEPKTIDVDGTTYEGENIIIASGSSPAVLPVSGGDGQGVLTSTDMLELDSVPSKLIVIGGGVIGLEFASLFSMVGTEVHVVEMLPEIIPFMDQEQAKEMRKAMDRMTFHLGAAVTSVEKGKVTFVHEGKEDSLTGDCILSAVGRTPNVEDMGLREIGLSIGPSGIRVNSRMQTSLPGVYAVGDVVGLSQFAHAASRMGEIAVDNICGKIREMNYSAIPWAIYTYPEAASCGLTEEQAKAEGYDTVAVRIPMRINARFLAENGPKPGSCSVVADKKSGEILGIHLLGGACSEMICSAAVMIENNLTIEDIRRTVFPHPSVSEVIREAALAL